MIQTKFVHLHVHSDYSMIDGLGKIFSIVKKTVDLNMPSIAVTDSTNLCGLIKFYKESIKNGIKPIIGADFFVKHEIFGKEIVELTILASNNIGYKNLTLLISEAYKCGYNNFGPTINNDLLLKYNEGLIVLSGAYKGDVGKCLINNNISYMKKCLYFYKKFFSDRYYIELTRTGKVEEKFYLENIIEIAFSHNLPVVATNDVRFIDPEDFYAHEIRVAIHNGYKIYDNNRPKKYSNQQYMRSTKEMCDLFYDIPEALINSVEIAKRCNVEINFEKYFLPKFPTGKISIEDSLIKYSNMGLKKRLKNIFPDNDIRIKKKNVYFKRLNHELKVINKMGFPGYFLIVMEFIKWSKDNNIPVGPGRGSGAGSLVAYALKITDINPLEFNLIFERFLNPERISMPDFDIDFCMEKRDLVIEHVSKKYGYDSVAQIITFGTLTSKSVIRDVGRVLGYTYNFVDSISKLIPSDIGITLKKSLKIKLQLKNLYYENKDVKILIDMSQKLEGVIRNVGKHAGGVVISPTKITDFSPIYCDNKGKNIVTQFDKNDIENIGLVKFDFLGLRTLTVISNTLKMINYNYIKNKLNYINISNLSLKDSKSFELLQNSETTAVFQLESRGMKDLIKRLKPDCFEDIISLVALFRPGPLQCGMVDNFINRKQGKESIFYPDKKWQHKSLKPVLEYTYGIILYQEQVMQIAQILAGFTLSKADILRCAMSKKKPNEMLKQRKIFKLGAKNKGIDNRLSMKIFDLLEKFSGYGFNKSHSTAYALISYQTLWLKAHYPKEFMASVMNADIDNTEKIVILINECLRLGLKILPPNINLGKYYFYVMKGKIIYGLGAIKGVGIKNIQSIIIDRNKNGFFKDFFDFCLRIDIKKLNRRVLEKLIFSGALDCLNLHRSIMFESIDKVIKTSKQYVNNNITGQKDMFESLILIENKNFFTYYEGLKSWSKKLYFKGEIETLGRYISGNPINSYRKKIKKYINLIKLKNIYPSEIINTIIGLILSFKILTNKNNQQIGICTIDDGTGILDLIMFNNIFKKYQCLLEKNNIIIAKGKVIFDYFNKKIKMNVSKIIEFKKLNKKYNYGLNIFINKKYINKSIINNFINLIKENKGTIPINIIFKNKNFCFRLTFGENWRIKPSENLIINFQKIFGNKKIKFLFNK